MRHHLILELLFFLLRMIDGHLVIGRQRQRQRIKNDFVSMMTMIILLIVEVCLSYCWLLESSWIILNGAFMKRQRATREQAASVESWELCDLLRSKGSYNNGSNKSYLDLDRDNIFMKDNPLLKWQVLSRFCQPAHLDSHQFVIVLGGL